MAVFLSWMILLVIDSIFAEGDFLEGGLIMNCHFRHIIYVVGILVLSCMPHSLSLAQSQADRFSSDREAMVRDQIRERGIKDGRVIDAMRSIPRHLFVPDQLATKAYDDSPLPIGYGQTISQPFIVAYMTELLNVHKNSIVLEIGTGSGYQAAILSPLVKKVYSLEIIPDLAKSAALRLGRLGFANVEVFIADGYYGLEKVGPFDAIIVTAAAGHIPPPLIKQLRAGGRMVIPVGGTFLVQNLVLVQKSKEGTITTRNMLPVRFVPLTGKHD
jgi:protein-L-isoaspartate(D-aspartate) O-methyltransferase